VSPLLAKARSNPVLLLMLLLLLLFDATLSFCAILFRWISVWSEKGDELVEDGANGSDIVDDGALISRVVPTERRLCRRNTQVVAPREQTSVVSSAK